MSLLDDVHERSIKEEIVLMATTLNGLQSRLQQVLTRLDARERATESWETRQEGLEKSLREAVNSAKWLRAQNEELEARLAQHKPELEQAFLAREASFKKLKHARKVIRDLLQERGDMSPRTQGAVTQEEIEEALGDDINSSHDSESSSSSSSASDVDSDRTVRLASAGFSTPAQIFTPQSIQAAHLSPAIQSENSSTASESFKSSETLMAVQPGSLSRNQSPSGSSTVRTSPETWNIHFKKPPGSSILQEGPIDWARLQYSLRLDEDTMNSLHSLSTSPDLSMRLQIIRFEDTKAGPVNIAFLYDPIFVEARHKSYVLDWGRRQTNQNVERYISRHKGVDLVFHVFTFPLNENNWFYIGAHNWSVVQVQDFWPLEGKLCNRSRGEVDEREMGRLLDSGELKQFCVELTSVTDARISYEFAAKPHGFLVARNDVDMSAYVNRGFIWSISYFYLKFSVISVSKSHASTVSPSSSQSTQTFFRSTLAASSEKLPTSSKTTTTRSIGSENRAPATTLAIPNNFMPTFTPPLSEPASSSSSAPPAVTPLSAAATTSSLWQKKGAVAAIFVIVALVILAITAILVVAFLKRRSARREVRLHDELFEKYTEPERRSPSPSASITAVPMDPFATSTVRYDTPPLFSDYAVPQSHPFVPSTSPVQHPNYCNQSPSRYLTPSQAQAARSSAPPSAFRGPEHRDSYQPSIDSFYGAGRPSGFST
ncbi:hypothetical protein CPB84DRAFT_1819771 [Gymnopilus junonius]|uniref:Uncharacterized protein n=1 Tax=Gymnopilus junonius TaxID=109634 RepID=A0A9P5P2R1_GYMJU|nr:hypothetical protein CPB84DRAFT_1819771 [Gymnopilus junonius]